MLKLSHPDVGTLDLDDGASYVTETVSLPLPTVREVSDRRTEDDGTYDRTAHFGARAVTASVVAFADEAEGVSLEQRVDALRRFLHPSLRSTLAWTPLGSTIERQLTVRAASHDVVHADPRFARTTIGWVAPLGVVESSELHSVTIDPAATGAEVGRIYDLTYDRTYPASTGGPADMLVLNDGTGPAAWVARLYGPCTDPELTNVTTGDTLAFVDTTLAAGHYIEVDTRARSALLDSDPTLSVYGDLSLTSVWWSLQPGENRVAFTPDTFSGGAVAVIEWRDTWL